MFCYQCSEALKQQGCTVKGVCGKNDEVATLQDLLIYATKGIGYLLNEGKKKGIKDEEASLFVLEALFATVTNVNFDPQRFVDYVNRALEIRDNLLEKVKPEGALPDAVTFKVNGKDDMLAKGTAVGVLAEANEDIRSLKELLVYGLKGIAAYADHAYVLQHKSDEIFDFVNFALSETLRKDITVDELVNLVMEAGNTAVKTMELLDKANTSRYGNPEITQVYTGLYEGPGILVSGHDLLDLEELLKQTEGTGVNVYTHGEMLPAHAYPELKKYKHLKGNFGTAWYNQIHEFPEFNGPILFTTNCIVPPKDSYFDRLFTTGLVGWPGVPHIPNRVDGKPKDFTPVIEKAKAMGGLTPKEGKYITIGFAHEQVMQVADKVIEAVKSGKIKRFIVMAGCDGRLKAREYYTEVAKKLPKDTVILTAGCAKYRYNMLDLGDIDGIPRILDAGQCNDSYSLAYIALKLKEAFGLNDINELPISYDIAWYEQKAVAVLLALLALGVKGIRLGPVLPAFLSPNVAKVLVENFDIKPIGDPDTDIELMLQGK
ncbi:hydroxylamine reductase [Deferribacter desulfuricans SSM1]|uniref:Hydroxylamine reductase n=1 Tax=Deferribacter desulfuricans (strain DSM 14783 / JCM 11476 / NBRC 101012 / SSM1) TaxID=639282 RepID=D3PCD1_DEFDS|nr:hydroxylamine reductase [Deferribacter desulfuricans]BAI80254.1 hydroxylamine reductase [Deferribacter desulfuricans SSM1]